MEQSNYVIIKEGLLNSIISDIVSFGSMALMFWFNYNYLGNSLLIKVLIVFLLFVVMVTRARKNVNRFKTKEDAIKYLEK